MRSPARLAVLLSLGLLCGCGAGEQWTNPSDPRPPFDYGLDSLPPLLACEVQPGDHALAGAYVLLDRELKECGEGWIDLPFPTSGPGTLVLCPDGRFQRRWSFGIPLVESGDWIADEETLTLSAAVFGVHEWSYAVAGATLTMVLPCNGSSVDVWTWGRAGP